VQPATLISSRIAAAARIGLLESKRGEAESVVNSTQDAIRQMMVLAPRDGTVVYATSFRGEKKKVGDSTWKAEKVIEIPDLTQMRGDGEVDEVDAGRVAASQRVTLRLVLHGGGGAVAGCVLDAERKALVGATVFVGRTVAPKGAPTMTAS